MFKPKSVEIIFVGYFIISKYFRVFNENIRISKESIHIKFVESASTINPSNISEVFEICSPKKHINDII